MHDQSEFWCDPFQDRPAGVRSGSSCPTPHSRVKKLSRNSLTVSRNSAAVSRNCRGWCRRQLCTRCSWLGSAARGSGSVKCVCLRPRHGCPAPFSRVKKFPHHVKKFAHRVKKFCCCAMGASFLSVDSPTSASQEIVLHLIVLLLRGNVSSRPRRCKDASTSKRPRNS